MNSKQRRKARRAHWLFRVPFSGEALGERFDQPVFDQPVLFGVNATQYGSWRGSVDIANGSQLTYEMAKSFFETHR